MLYLPLVLARSPMLAELVRNAAQDPRQRRLCGRCGARVVLTSAGGDQDVRCQFCRREPSATEAPWRLTAASAERLRRIKSWPRCL